MKLAYFPKQTAQNAEPVMQAFLSGCQRMGINTVENDMHADAAVIWSMLWAGRMRDNRQVWEKYRAQNKPVIVLEVGGLQRGQTWRVGLNGVNGQAYFGTPAVDGIRAQSMGLKLRPWRSGGDHVMVCLQRHESHQWQNMPVPTSWLDTTIHHLKKFTDRPIVIRPHPRQIISGSWSGASLQAPQKLKDSYDCYDFNPQGSWAVVNWNSNPGPQSVIQGVPVFVGPDSLASPVGNSDFSAIENPIMPDRQAWLNNLAYTEWTIQELYQALPQKRLLNQC